MTGVSQAIASIIASPKGRASRWERATHKRAPGTQPVLCRRNTLAVHSQKAVPPERFAYKFRTVLLQSCFKFFGPIQSGQITSVQKSRRAVAFSQHSRRTSLAFLSSRNPRKTGARNFLSRVHSANLISQTNTGFSQCILRVMEGVIPSTHCPFCLDGRSAKGQLSLSCC
jgi:hypothetical protein